MKSCTLISHFSLEHGAFPFEYLHSFFLRSLEQGQTQWLPCPLTIPLQELYIDSVKRSARKSSYANATEGQLMLSAKSGGKEKCFCEWKGTPRLQALPKNGRNIWLGTPAPAGVTVPLEWCCNLQGLGGCERSWRSSQGGNLISCPEGSFQCSNGCTVICANYFAGTNPGKEDWAWEGG